ncbi:hypothetical protein [Streptomyces doebereineriae]|uniref:Uncharacterized protein n=1 Tax=Streptomyces doebereineriae TaxID=3075528 RepID=A0ABU2VJB2_9ACTN|nr:hypothetical protein [Streptomyces sp. DSM 41640]MDT0485350.1 hypothetical protein [Streptomyces sp. DSM 41640]
MTYEPVDLNLTDPTKGYLNFVLYTEARLGIASTSLNADVSIAARQAQTPHFEEWLSRLVRCEPNAMHCTLVEPTKIPALFRPCVEEDKDSPSVVRGSGCVCRRTFYDPEFGLPVVGAHFKHAGAGGTDQWSYNTYAPLDLRPGDTFDRFLVSGGLFWARTEKGLLSILPQRNGLGYNIGYNGGGPHALAAYLTQVAVTDGQNTAAGAAYEKAHPAIVAWTQSSAEDRGTNTLTLSDLKAMQQR